MRALASLICLAGCIPGYWEQVDWIDAHGVQVSNNAYPVDQAEFTAEVDYTLDAWQFALGEEGIKCELSACMPLMHVAFAEWPVECPWTGDPLNGYEMQWWAAYRILVGYETPLANSALGHELGHAILSCCKLSANELALRSWADKYGVPY